jgi:hypothetical protein
MAEDVRVDCVRTSAFVCRDDETTCSPSPPPFRESVTYHFTFDLTKKTGSLVFCVEGGSCLEPSPLTVVHDYCAAIGNFGAGCLNLRISVWEQVQHLTWTISNSRYVTTNSGVGTDYSQSVIQFGRCAVQ